jgi:hypothetical protein
MLVVIVLMNLLVGLAVSDIQGLQKSAGLDRLVRQSRLIARMESIVFSAWFNFLPLTAKNFLQQNVLLIPSTYNRVFTCRPNDPRDDRFPKEIKEGILKVLVCNKKSKVLHGSRYTSSFNYNGLCGTMACDHEELIEDIQQKISSHFKQINMFTSNIDQRLLQLEQQWGTVQQTMEQLAQLIKQNSSSPIQ